MKKILEPNNAMYLLPAVLVTCCDSSGKINYLKLNPILYGDKAYWSIKDMIGYRGFSQKI